MRAGFATLVWMVGLLCGQEGPEPWVAVYHPAEQWRVGAPVEEGIDLAPGSLADVRSSFFYNRQECANADKVAVRARAEAGGEWREGEVLEGLDCSGFRVRLPELPLGRALIALQYDGAAVGMAAVTIVDSYFGILAPVGDEAGRRARLGRAAAGGGVISILGTGLGTLRREEIHGELDGTPLTLVDMRREVDGAALDMLRFRLPERLPVEGCYVPVAVRVAERWSEVVPVAVSSGGGACRHPLGLTEDQMAVLDSGRSIGLGQVEFRSLGFDSYLFSAGVWVAGVDAVAGVAFERYGEGCQALPPYRPELPPIVRLESGETAVRGPDGRWTNASGSVLGRFAPGDYAVKAAGGRDVLPFEVEVRIPEVPASARRMRLLESGELLMEWDGALYAEGDVLTVSARTSQEDAGFLCKAPARGGRMAIPGRAERIGWVDVVVERNKQRPLLFPVTMSNGVRFPGVVNYQISGGFRVIVSRGQQ